MARVKGSIADILRTANRRPTDALDGNRGRLSSTAAMVEALCEEDGAPWWFQQRSRTAGSVATPTISEAQRCWIYSPPALDKGPVLPRRSVGEARFEMWKVGGFLHVQAAGAAEALVLPVYTSDGIGYPALSSVLRAWMEAGNERWQLFHRYMQAALQGDGCDASGGWASFDLLLDNLSTPRKTLDTRYCQTRSSKEWLYAVQLDGSVVTSSVSP